MNASMSPVMSKAVSGAAGSVIAMSEALSGSPEHHPGPNTAGPNTAVQPTTGVHSPVQPLPSSVEEMHKVCLLYTSPSPRDRTRSRMPSSA